MYIVKSLAVGLVIIVISPWIGFALSLLVGLIVDPFVAKIVAESSLKKFRYVWSFVWIGFTFGVLNALSIYFLGADGIILLIFFVIYHVFFMKHKTEVAYHDLCDGDTKKFKKLSRFIEVATFLSFLIGLYGLWTVLQM